MPAFIHRFAHDESGATAIEYGLLAAAMGIGLIAAFTLFGGNLGGLFNTVGTEATTAINGAGS